MPSFIYYSIFIFFVCLFNYCWPAFTSLTLLTLASIWQLNTLHYSAMFTVRTDMQLIAAFFISNPWGHMKLPLSARFPIGVSLFLCVFYLICLYRTVWTKNEIRFLLTLVTDNIHLRIAVFSFYWKLPVMWFEQLCGILFKHYVPPSRGVPTHLPFEGIFDLASKVPTSILKQQHRRLRCLTQVFSSGWLNVANLGLDLQQMLTAPPSNSRLLVALLPVSVTALPTPRSWSCTKIHNKILQMQKDVVNSPSWNSSSTVRSKSSQERHTEPKRKDCSQEMQWELWLFL